MGLIKKIQNQLAALRIENLFLNSSSVFIRRILGMGLSFFWVFAITNFFGAEAYGLFSLGQVVVSFCAMFFGLGIDMAVIKFTSNTEHYDGKVLNSDFFNKIILIIIISSLLCFSILFFFKTDIAEIIFKDSKFLNYLTLISYFFFLFVLHKSLLGFLTVKGDFIKYANYFFVLPNLLVLLFVILIFLIDLPRYFTIGGYLIAYGIFGLIVLYSIFKSPIQIKRKVSFNSILKLSMPMMISSGFLFVMNWTDTLMLGVMVSKSDLGIYNAAYKLSTIAIMVLTAVNTVLSPKISSLYEKDEIEGIKEQIYKATRIITIFTLPIVIILIVFSKYILGLFGEEFIFGRAALTIISIGLLFNAMSGSVGLILNMTKHQKQFRNFTIISAILNIVLNWVLIKKYGINGAAIASLISNIVLNLLGIFYVKKKFGFYSFLRLN